MPESLSLPVIGMKCGGCENSVTAKLTQLDGVLSVKASHQDKRVDVEYDPDKVDPEEIEDAITAAGFSVE